MVKGLLAIVGLFRSAWLFETAGAGLIVAGAYLAWGDAAALAAGGVALLAKSVEFESRNG